MAIRAPDGANKSSELENGELRTRDKTELILFVKKGGSGQRGTDVR